METWGKVKVTLSLESLIRLYANPFFFIDLLKYLSYKGNVIFSPNFKLFQLKRSAFHNYLCRNYFRECSQNLFLLRWTQLALCLFNLKFNFRILSSTYYKENPLKVNRQVTFKNFKSMSYFLLYCEIPFY